MLLISFIHITDTEWNISRKDQEGCYNKCSVNRCSCNIGITNCTTVTVTTNLHDFSQAV